MKRWEMDATMEPAECGAWVSGDEAEAEIEKLKRLLRRAAEAIEHTVDLDDGNLTESERQWVIDQAITTVTDIREALKEDR